MNGGAVTWDWVQGVFRVDGEPVYYLVAHEAEPTSLFTFRDSITRLAALQCQLIDVDLDGGLEIEDWAHNSLSIVNLSPKGGYDVQTITVGADGLLMLHDVSVGHTNDLDLSVPHIWTVEARRFYEAVS